MKYIVENPDWNTSPYTGMTKKHWLDVCKFLLEGVFSHIKDPKDPIVLPRHEYVVSYPQIGQPAWRYGSEKFEGLARTFLVGSQLIKNCPDTTIGKFNLKEYYAKQILLALDKENQSYIGRLDDMLEEPDDQKAFQHTCECASLVLGLMVTKQQIWDQYTIEEKDKIAELFSEFGHYKTNHHNWRLFNILILSFLKTNGYSIEEAVLKDHIMNVMSYYVGDGWYKDGNLFDYYSPWAFQVYAPLWNIWYGYEHEPELAAMIEKASNDLMENYPYFFDKNGHSTMWGRSNIYRSAASAPLAVNMMLKKSKINPGLARRILSGNLLQFIEKEETFIHQIPCLGFYGPFKPMLQHYSCAASPFWFANSFLCLSLDDDSPFWTAKENNGIWEENRNQSTSVVLDGPGIMVTNHDKTGSTELHTSKVMLECDSPWKSEYLKLAFNSAFPWQAESESDQVAMQYSIRLGNQTKALTPNLALYAGVTNHVLYRRIYFNFAGKFKEVPSIDLADIPIPGGFIRVDRLKIADKPYELMLGHYGMPIIHQKMNVVKKIQNGNLLLTSYTDGLKLALISYEGWDNLDYEINSGLNAISKDSLLLYGRRKRTKMYDGMEVIITVMLHGQDSNEWKEEELNPIRKITYYEVLPENGGFGVELLLRDGRNFVVDFGGIEKRLMI